MRPVVLLFTVAALCAVGCDDASTTGGGGDGGTGTDGVVEGSDFGSSDGGFRFDARRGEDGEELGQFQDDCEDNIDCASGWCVPYEDRTVCSQTCLHEGCPNGWGCRAVANTEPDVVFICYPPGNRLCGVCVGDGDCPNGRCHEVDGQMVCGIDCDDDSACPDGNSCEQVAGGPSQCVPNTRSCTCDAAHAGEQRVCEKSNAFGSCFGRETCDPEAGWRGCTANEPAAEVCNDVDDDCNGFTDDLEGKGDMCERSIEIDGETSACRGILRCERGSEQLVCSADEPMEELCNLIDDDCDGEIDEGFEELGAICLSGIGQCQRVGVFECNPEGEAAVCSVEPGEPAEELCDSQDNDCDGEVDEDFPTLNDLCSVGVGACRRAGALRCTVDGSEARCTATPGEPADEVCDGIDNDCDGTADEGFEGLFEPCSVGEGACLRQGFLFCTEDGANVACTAEPAEPGEEVCNGVDDNCDGAVDETFEGLNEPCNAGVGLCNRAGVTACSEDGTEVVCNARPAAPGPELCNGLDDNCNGEVDETFPELDRICEVGVGACGRVGVLSCSPDGLGTICAARPAEPAEDVCNGLDDDCDGAVDEDFPLRDRPCTAGEGLCERNGVYRCNMAGDDVVCDAVAAEPAEERCDGLDNDCDGISDEGYDELDELCEVGVGACLRTGIRVCTEDGEGVECNAEAGLPSPEICDGVDNNCDGVVDDGFDDLLTPCNVGVGQCLRGGVRVCAQDGQSTICNVRPGDDGAEVCDGLDNDCDGMTDEGYQGLGTACAVGVGACEVAGVRRCAPDGQSVVCDAVPDGPEPELCDRLDNDCDGDADEEFEDLGRACSAGVGSCQRFGVVVCAEDGQSAVCDAVAANARAETCNGLDDDCNGVVDDGFQGLGRACSVGLGLCLRFGVNVCDDDGQGVVCDAAVVQGDDEVCDRLDNDCDGSTDEGFAGLGTACSAGVGSCQRAGVRTCSEDGAGVVCDAAPGDGVAERCDGVDNDCDGQTDEGFAGVGTPCSEGIGTCERAGVNRCSADGQRVECSAVPAEPGPEVCDGLDNNCDGRTDENFAGLATPCTVGVGACRDTGIRVCSEDGQQVVCSVSPGEPAPEICDGVDNNCDGVVDEAFPNKGRPCSAGVGACQRPGVQVCVEDGLSTACNAVAADPEPEVCDGIDNNCDGNIDEGFPGLRTACTAGDGVCLRAGVRICSDDGQSVVCDAVAGQPGAERCNGLDDDCDGERDEIFVGLGTACTVGQGVCLRNGVRVCAENGISVVCDAQPGQGGQEVCDGADNDCDGTVDEGFPGIGVACSDGVGACRVSGVTVCAEDGSAVVCNAVAGDGGPEVCDRIDNDCDGQTDEGFANLDRPCTAGTGECLAAGVYVCSGDGAQVVCDAEPGAPGAEVCDGVDNDCDGQRDEGFANLGRACSVGVGACRENGVVVCSQDGAGTVCDAVAGQPGNETCNGLDDDCDGTIDDGFAGLGTACAVGQGVCRANGVVVCAANGAGTECNAEAGQGGDERCNGLDDDCDGSTDEGFANLGRACSVGTGECREAGVNVCRPDGAGTQCDAVAGNPVAERCDGLDNDCDGAIDDGFAGLNTACSAGVGECRSSGVQVCRQDGSGVECNATPGNPVAERCDGLDNDCDGVADDGFAGLGDVCSAGVGACARSGVQLCAADGSGVQCNAVPGNPAAERCDAIDNNCDGRTDENFANLGQPCTAGVGICLRQGVQLCTADGSGVACNAVAGNPAAEVCDGLDNNCNGQTDELFVDKNEPCSVGVGICLRVGVKECRPDGAATQCNVAPGNAEAEVCDLLDNDCNGTVDDAWPTRGQSCTVGLGVCRRSGVFTCNAQNPAGAVVCDAAPGQPAANEACDYNDDDCDGSTDEDFVDGQGRYVTLAHCGACGNDCNLRWDPNPAAFGVAPKCTARVGGADCGYDCLPGFLDADQVPDNGCELEIDPFAIYVSTLANGGVDNGACGTVQAPCATIGFGLTQAQLANKLRVRVSDGVYQERVDLIEGIDVLGGHHRTTWVRDSNLNVTIIEGRDDGASKRAVSAIGIDADTTLDGFVINGESVLQGGNSYAVYIRDCGPGLTISNNRIFAGDGGRGVDGLAGGSGAAGAGGSPGSDSFSQVIPACGAPADNEDSGAIGGAGGQRSCSGVLVHGGRGADSECPAQENQEPNGAAGRTARGGAGGAGGWDFRSDMSNRCLVSNGGPADASPGADGTNGPDGNGGSGAAGGVGTLFGNDWVGNTGTAGTFGLAGGGGGGGGAAAGVDVDWDAPGVDFGAAGGGGGAGGCGGLGGGAGQAGGGSFGVFIVFTGVGPANAAAYPTIEDNEIRRGLGGNGGAGGNGGGGGEGGVGGVGGQRGDNLFMDFCSFAAGDGGTGGRGGHAGGGGGGQGGVSYDVYVFNHNNALPNFGVANDFALAAGVSTHGDGGPGGNSSNTGIGLGGAGADGQSGNVAGVQ